MSNKIPVGILGATGMVGERYISYLQNHPWFQVVHVAASPRSAGKKYKDAVENRWLIGADIPENVANMVITDAADVGAASKCAFVFSALEMEKPQLQALEEAYAQAGIPVVSNASAHRWTDDVPVLIPEINAHHLDIIKIQQKNRGWNKGFIVTKPNCSIQSYMIPLYALIQAGFPVKRLIVTTMQAVTGAGYPGVSSFDITGNVVPFIGGEEEKTETEPLKIFGSIDAASGKIINAKAPVVAAHCNRVPVIDGHTACVSLEFAEKKPDLEQIEKIWANFRSVPQELNLPSAPEQPIVLRHEENRPQPRRDRETGKGMAVSVGRLRGCPVFDIRFVGLSHNTKRGAALGGVLNAELLSAQGFF